MTPDGWSARTLGELCEQFKEINVSAEDLPPLSVTKDAGIVLQSEKFNKRIATDISKYKVLRRGRFAYDPMSLYYGAIGRQERVPAGLVSPAYITFALRDDLDPGFFWYAVKGQQLRSAFTAATQGGNVHGKRKNTDWESFCAIRTALPPGGEQRKIAAVLSSVDDAIEATQKVVDQLGVVGKATMTELLTCGLPGRHTRYKQTEVGQVPEPWQPVTIGELASFSGGNGFRPPDWSTSGLPIIRIQNLNGSKEFNYFRRTPDPTWVVEAGELLFAWAGTRGASFGPCIWPGPRGVLNQHIYRIAPNDLVLKRYLYYLLRLVTEQVEKKAHGFKTSLVHLRKHELTGWRVALPPGNEQSEIVAVIAALEERLGAEQRALAGLTVAKEALSNVLLTGEVRVTPDEAAA